MAVHQCVRAAIQWVLDEHRPSVVALDTETTGLRGAVIQLALVELDAHGAVRDSFCGLVHPPPDYPMERGAVAVHGITAARLHAEAHAPGPFFVQATERLKRARAEGKRVVAHNAAFDVIRVRETLAAHRIDADVDKVFCTMQAAKRHCGLVDRRGRARCPKNGELYAILFDGADARRLGPLHDAATDATVTAHCFLQGRRAGWWA